MIKVIDEVTGTAIKIEVIGKPYQYQVRIGKVGTWTVARGRTAGTIKTGEKWDHPMFCTSLKHVLTAAVDAISENEGIPKEHINLAGAEAWKVLVAEEAKRIQVIEAIHNEFQKLIDEHGKDLAGLSKLLAKGKVEADEEPDPDEAEEAIVSEPVTEVPHLFPKLEARLAEEDKR